ncbi:MAG TPA: YHS domain-containing (seleno)protein [Gemmata sp.]|nr:YHS domain-containing (seleno)protein [Gemmata sp.]
MKRLLYSLTRASLAAVIILAGNNAVSASEKQTLDPAQNTAEKGSDSPAQDDSQKVAKSGPTTKVNVDSQGVILRGYDVVAYFKQGKPVQGNPAFESTYQGAIYLFASSVDKTDFEKDPAKYAPRYGGFCSYAAALGILGQVEGPDAFAVYKGRLYICGNQSSLKEFKANIDTNIGKADANWRLLGSIPTNAPSSRAGAM